MIHLDLFKITNVKISCFVLLVLIINLNLLSIVHVITFPICLILIPHLTIFNSFEVIKFTYLFL